MSFLHAVFRNVSSYFFVIVFSSCAMHGNKHINKATKSCKLVKILKNLDGIRSSTDATIIIYFCYF